MQVTSLETYEKIKKELGRRQAKVLEIFDAYNHRTLTNTEIAAILEWPINTVTPRVFELREKGIVKEDCKRKCGVTGRTAIAWRIKRPDEIMERQMEWGI